jgi:hypothetical protein
MSEILADLLSITNAIVFGTLGAIALINGIDGWRQCIKNKPSINYDPFWIWFLLSAIGFYWSVLYVWILFVPTGVYDPIWFGRIFIRPAYVVTGGTMLIIAIVYAKSKGTLYRLRHGCRDNEHS